VGGEPPRVGRPSPWDQERIPGRLATSTPTSTPDATERNEQMHVTTLPKLAAATALAGAVLGVTPLAQAGVAQPQKHPEIIGVLNAPQIIGVLDTPQIIGVLGRPRIIGVLKHPEIIGVLKHRTLVIRKAGGS
jgi:hypothetical protein